MKTLIITLLLITPLTAQAAICDDLSDVSGAIMTARQNGMSMSELWRVKADKRLRPYTRSKIKDAYSEPKYSTDEYQQNAINDFKDQAFLECIKAVSK